MLNKNMISIVIPTIGSGPISYLKESLESANSVSAHPLLDNIYIIDNSNSDELSQLISSYTDLNEKFKHIKVTAKMSMAQCWNKGLSLISSQWLLYLHDDDIINYEEFMKIDESELNKDVGYIAFDFTILQKKRVIYTSIETGIKGIIQNTPKFISTIYYTQKLKDIGGWDERAGYALDLLAIIKLCHLYGDRKINRSLGKYRIHEQNSSSIEKRSKSYGDAIPYVLGEVFKIIDDASTRKLLSFHLLSFTYPNQTIIQKGINWVLQSLGLNAWIISKS